MRNSRTAMARVFFILGLVACVTIHSHAATVISSVPTQIESTATRMISYRHQEHMWQTGDGGIHLMVNLGSLGGENASLTLFSSFDDGQSWDGMISLANTDDMSTSDGQLEGNDLNLVYSTITGDIVFCVLTYDANAKDWESVWEEMAFGSPDCLSSNPTTARDNEGRKWCAFVSRDVGTLVGRIRIVCKADEASGWQDTGLMTTVSQSLKKSARLITLANGVGMVHTSPERIIWAYRANSWEIDRQWVEKLLFRHQKPYAVDPYASHFSIVDEQENIHVAATEKGRLIYVRYDGATQSWEPARYLTSDLGVGYVQATTANNKVFLFFNLYTMTGVVQSDDGGESFFFAYLLNHPRVPEGRDIDYSFPRMETPGRSKDLIPVVRQYVDGGIQKLIYFPIPVESR